jgi:diguanylate cyclase (GGDEF)-like protein
VTSGNWLSNTVDAIRRSPSASALVLVLVLVLLESIPLEMLVWQPGTTPETVDQALLLGFAILMLGAALAWYGTARPIEATLREDRQSLKAIFVANPDAIAVYDREGRLVRGNGAAAALIRRPPEDLVGAHFETHVAPEQMPAMQAAFVLCALSPHVVRGRVIGVFAVVRDVTDLALARAIEADRAGRLAEIANLADSSAPNMTRMHNALALLCRRFHFEEAFVAEIDGDRVRLVAQETSTPGDTTPVPIDVLRRVAGGSGIAEINDYAASVRSFAGIAIGTGTGSRGVLGLVSSYGRSKSFEPVDRDFIRVVASLVTFAMERGRQKERTGQLAFHDALTGLPNRLLVIERLSEILGSAKWRGMHFAVLYIDLAGFKEVNDTFGHDTGDRILRLAARRIADSISSLDLLARLGGDEFAVVQPLPDGDAHAEKLARRILAAISAPFTVDGNEHRLSATIGINISANGVSDGSSLMQRADEALYGAKSESENKRLGRPKLQSLAS